MLDLAFLAVAVFAIYKANKGEYNETACNIAMVVGIIAGVFGCVVGITKGQGMFVFLNVIVICGSFGLRFAAKHLAKLYVDKIAAETEAWEKEARDHARFSDPDKKPVYTDDTFDDEELRFGKGGFTDQTIDTPANAAAVYDFDDDEPLFGNSYTRRPKVSLEKKKVSLAKAPLRTDNEDLRFGNGRFTDPKL